jgi:hypothetical protein
VSPSVHATLYASYSRELHGLLDVLLAGEVVTDRGTAERLVRMVGALQRLHDQHRLDDRGRCTVCRPVPRTWWRPWPKRFLCTVQSALDFDLRQPAQFVYVNLADKPDA